MECSLFIQFRTYYQGTVGLECSLFIRILNLPPGNCRAGVKHIYTSEPTSRGLFARGTGSLCSFLTYLQGTVRWGAAFFIRFLNLSPGNCRLVVQLFIWFPNLPQGNCRMGLQLVYDFQIYLQDTVGRRCSLFLLFLTFQETVGQGLGLFIRVLNLPQGPVQLWCSLLINFQNLLTRYCRPEVQPIYTVSEPTSRGL